MIYPAFVSLFLLATTLVSLLKISESVTAMYSIRRESRKRVPRNWHLYLGEPFAYSALKYQANRFPVRAQIQRTRMEYIVAHALDRDQNTAEMENRSHGRPQLFIMKQMAEFAQSATPVVHERVLQLMERFIEFKQINGSSLEKALYKGMNIADFVDRLLTKRPFMFIDLDDAAMLRDQTRVKGGFELIGSENEKPPLVLRDYISYDEMKISAFLLVSSASYFVNNGNRYNHGEPQPFRAYEDAGIIIGVIGPRFEKPNVMEYQDIIVTPDQNTPENGYGLEGLKANPVAAARLKLFADFYGVSRFPSYDETREERGIVRIGSEKTTGAFGMADILVDRFLITAETVILEAERRAAIAKQSAFVRVIGYGLGVWKFPGWYDERAWRKAIDCLKLEFVTDINFIWLHEGADEEFGVTDGGRLGNVTIHFSDNNPQDRLVGDHKGKLLIVTNAADSNAYPGNEFWCGSLDGSGDAAAACSTQIAELHNPMINIHLRGNRLLVASPTDNYVYSAGEYLKVAF